MLWHPALILSLYGKLLRDLDSEFRTRIMVSPRTAVHRFNELELCRHYVSPFTLAAD